MVLPEEVGPERARMRGGSWEEEKEGEVEEVVGG